MSSHPTNGDVLGNRALEQLEGTSFGCLEQATRKGGWCFPSQEKHLLADSGHWQRYQKGNVPSRLFFSEIFVKTTGSASQNNAVAILNFLEENKKDTTDTWFTTFCSTRTCPITSPSFHLLYGSHTHRWMTHAQKFYCLEYTSLPALY